VELVTSDTYTAALEGMRGRVSVFKQCIQHLPIPAAALLSAGGFCGVLSWLLALLVFEALQLSADYDRTSPFDPLSTCRPEWQRKKVRFLLAFVRHSLSSERKH
jgi:hypothetical protein